MGQLKLPDSSGFKEIAKIVMKTVAAAVSGGGSLFIFAREG